MGSPTPILPDTYSIRYVFIYTWMNKALYYRTNPAWNLCDFRTFFASSGTNPHLCIS